MYSSDTFKKTIRLTAVALAIVSHMTSAQDSASVDSIPIDTCTITVHADGRQTFEGFGAGQSLWDAQQGYDSLPDSVRDTLSRFLWSDLNFRYLRLRSTIRECGDTNDNCAASVYRNYKRYLQDAKKHQKELIVVLAPHGVVGTDIDSYAHRYALQIKALRDSGVVVKYTGISNEPDIETYLTAEQVPICINAFRRNLDSLGLNDVQIIAPENSSSDPKGRLYVNAILNNPQATQSTAAFATHSYNISITDEMTALVKSQVLGGTKSYWTTEASEFGTEKWEDAKEASSALSRYFADMNHLCSVWMFYVGIKGVESDWRMSGEKNTAFYMILYRTAEHDWRYLLKCYYFRQIGQTIVPGAVMRKATTNLRQVSALYNKIEDSTMVYGFGRKPPLYLAAGVNPDGSWGIGITNYTSDSLPRDTSITAFAAATAYNVAVKIEELADSGDISFAAYRCNAVAPYIHKDSAVLMQNGTMTVDSIGPFDMITLRSASGIVGARHHQAQSSPHIPQGGFITASRSVALGSGAVDITFSVPRRAHVEASHVKVSVFDMRGRRAAMPLNARMPAGQHSLIWQASNSASGMYLITLEYDNARMQTRIILGK
jgi:O-glycosyl hydrolase